MKKHWRVDMFQLIKFLLFSGNKATYRAIAREYNTSSFHVYRLAHGKLAKNNKEYRILKSLREKEIIEGVYKG